MSESLTCETCGRCFSARQTQRFCSRSCQNRAFRRASHSAVLAHYAETNSAADTARAFGISRERVRQILNKNGINPRSRREAGEARRLRTDAIVAELHRRGLDNTRIVQASWLRELAVRISVARQGLRRNPTKRINTKSTRVDEAVRMFNAGASVAEIAEAVGYEREMSARQALYRRGCRFRERKAAMENANA